MSECDELDFVPSTEQVRSHYVFDQGDKWSPERGRRFDDWLARVKAEAAAGTVEGILDAMSETGRASEHGVWLTEYARILREEVK